MWGTVQPSARIYCRLVRAETGCVAIQPRDVRGCCRHLYDTPGVPEARSDAPFVEDINACDVSTNPNQGRLPGTPVLQVCTGLVSSAEQ